jgi:hypothetical protein
MSLGIFIKGPEGLVLAADSRITLANQVQGQPPFLVNFDNATKLLNFSCPNSCVGAVTYGQALVGLTQRTAQSFLPEFEQSLDKVKRLPIKEFVQKLSDFYMKQWQVNEPPDYHGLPMVFVVGGYNEDEYFGRVFIIEIPFKPDPIEQNPGPSEFGFTWGGQKEIVDRIMSGYDSRLLKLIKDALDLNPTQVELLNQVMKSVQFPIPINLLPLQDCVNLAIYFIRSTIDAQNLSVNLRGVGGPIDVATITRREGFKFIQRKEIIGEGGTSHVS